MGSGYPPFHEFILSSLSNTVEERPEALAFLSAENEFNPVTFKEIQNAILSVAGYFQASNCKKGEIVTISLPNTWHYSACYLGAASAGMVTSGMSPDFTAYETEYQLANSQSKAVLTTGNNLNKIIQASKNLPHLKIILYIGALPSTIAPTPLKLVNFDEIISKEYPFNPKLIQFNVDEDLLALPYSSGTTGMPKGVMITHANFMIQISILAMHHMTKIDVAFPPDENRGPEYKIHFLPSYHAYGFAGLCLNILKGCTTIIMKHFKAHLFLSLVEKYKVAQLNLVPMLLNYLSESPDVEKYDLSSIRFISSGGLRYDKVFT
uniref:AMP-dependent synthetase/ligase domain-containing protein n=1 Tax=Panagrolaimus superbus TaxID=310955 RepID=A0A914XPQ8_9BILA